MKKILALLVTSLLLVSVLTSCAVVEKIFPSKSTTDGPLEIAEHYDKKGYDVLLKVDDDELEEMAEDIEFGDQDFEYALIVSDSESSDTYKYGVFVFCKDEDTAQKVEAKLNEQKEESSGTMDSFVVNRDGKIVFLGTQSVWEDKK